MVNMEHSGEFWLTQKPDGSWIWTWLPGLMVAGCHVTGTRSYSTKAGAMRSAKSCVEKMRRYHVDVSRGDMV